MRKATIIKIGYQSFALTSKADAGKLIDLMSKIIPVESDYVEGIGRVLFPAEKSRDVSVEFNQDFYLVKPSPPREVQSPRHSALHQNRQLQIGGKLLELGMES